MAAKQHDFEADTGKILDIVINSLYSEKEIFLRELISNASDALDKRRYMAATDQSLQSETGYAIHIVADEKAKTLTISDNGVGMDDADMASALGTIARSGSKAFIEQIQAETSSDKKSKDAFSLIGQFGVGFYSAFMVADKIDVISRKAGDEKAWHWSSDGKTGYSLDGAKRAQAGTDITLHLKKGEKDFLDETRIGYLVRKYSDHLGYAVNWQPPKVDEPRQLNTGSAIWTRAKKDISEEDYTQFYRQIGAVYDEPFMTLHNSTEGMLNYTSLLFVPTSRPFDLFNPDRKSRMSLYINRVFITDECEDIVPPWLRFIRGVIDTPDMDLNVSREMLQKNPSVQKIGKALIKRILGELKKKKEKDPEAYEAFWDQFGMVLKEGLYEDIESRDKILEICLFRSARSGTLISLADYVAAMPDTQDKIYTLSAENAEQAETSPHLEGFRARDIDVLLMTDPVDEFWMQAVTEFEGKAFASATRGISDLDKVAPKSDSEKAEEIPDDDARNQEFASLITKVKATLGEDVKEVRLSKTLTDSPVCLVADEEGMDIQMERLMKAHNKDFAGSPRILEINPDHKLIKGMASQIEANGDPALLDDAAKMLLDQAQILEGRPPASLTEFAKRMTRLMERGLSA
ncbi:MAG: Chaperone protein HtpG [Rhodospirillaceae bacterium]|jgi:molecular chaperone HtpG|nr:MAG: Chaperone protein HtpG [Rhodospirillaceae bacterium]